jgi:hypothetical protein
MTKTRKRNPTLQADKEKVVINEFRRLAKSGKDYTTESMYEDAGKKGFLTGRRAGDIIRKHYKEAIISSEMKSFIESQVNVDFDTLHTNFCLKFKVCKREGRLIIGYVR